MRVLYGLQGTGFGHISRAAELIPLLAKKCKLEILISGYNSSNPLPFAVNFQFNGLTFYPSKSGGIDLIKTVKSLRIKTLYQDIISLDTSKYDLIISDFEPISAYAAILGGIPLVELSHQASILKKHCPKPTGLSWMHKLLLKIMCPAKSKIGFHFASVDNQTFTPVIRKSIRELNPKDNGSVLVYLPAYHHEHIVNHFTNQSEKHFIIYSANTNEKLTYQNICIKPLSTTEFTKDLLNCHAVICGAGFETPAEALYLGKKLIVIPMKAQFEQQCNALFLKSLGIRMEDSLYQINSIDNWLLNAATIRFDYPDISESILSSVLAYGNSNKPEEDISTLATYLYLRDS